VSTLDYLVNGKKVTSHGGHRMTQNRSPSAWLVAILAKALL